ncbi:MAG: shikimate dehydrogenase [Rickettsiales bacterium]
MEENKAAVIGYPIAHSLSPIIHNYWLKEHKILGEYSKISVKPQDLEKFILTLPQKKLTGINITIPHKEEAYKILQEKAIISELATSLEAINTIYVKNNKIYADNTDYYGFKSGLLENLPNIDLATKEILVIGAGGAAKAIIFGLIKDKVRKITVINRTKEKAEILAKKSEKQIITDNLDNIEHKITHADIVINTTSCGLNNLNHLKIDHSKIRGKKIFYDIVYKPLNTKFLIDAKKNGHQIIAGINMLIYQAQPAFECFFGINPKITEKQIKFLEEQAQKY